MNRNATRFLVPVALAVLLIVGCGEKAMEPANTARVAADGAGEGSADLEAAGGHGPRNVKGTLLIASKGGVIALSPDGDSFLFHPYGSHTSKIEVMGTRIFWHGGTRIVEFDHLGNVIADIDLPDRIQYGLDFTALPDGNFAVQDCLVDSVYFLDPMGAVYRAVAMPESSPGPNLQNMRGLIVDGNLLVSETGTKKIAQIDLATYATSIFRDFSVPFTNLWLGDIGRQGPHYYVARPNKLQRFTETGRLRDVAEFEDDYNLVAFAIIRHRAYAAFNHAGKVFEINLSSGKATCLLEGLDYPTDIEFIPVILEPPVAARLGPHGG